MENSNSRPFNYPNIPDHSDLRGFTYRAPTNYQWQDDHHDRRMESFSRAPKGYRRPDASIREEICESLIRHTGIDASEIEVTVNNGIVTMAGSVPCHWMKRASEWLVEEVSGVGQIQNRIKIL